MHHGDSALVGGGAESRKVPRDAAAERGDVVRARDAGRGELLPDTLGLRKRLALLAGLEQAGSRASAAICSP